jgi:hypothetical protein
VYDLTWRATATACVLCVLCMLCVCVCVCVQAALLLDWGADVDSVDVGGASAFLVACLEGHTEVVAWLATLAPHIDMSRPDRDGTTPWFAAVNQVGEPAS